MNHQHQKQQQKPAKNSCKARVFRAADLKPGDWIVWCRGTCEAYVNQIRFGWWRAAYVEINDFSGVLILAENERVLAIRAEA